MRQFAVVNPVNLASPVALGSTFVGELSTRPISTRPTRLASAGTALACLVNDNLQADLETNLGFNRNTRDIELNAVASVRL